MYSQNWSSSLGGSVKYYENRTRVGVIVLASMFFFANTAFGEEAVAPTQTDGSTVTAVAKTGIEKYRGATSLTDVELKELLQLVGFSGKSLKLAWAVAKRESNGHPLSHNVNSATGDNSYGLFQINMIGSLGEERLAKFNLKAKSDLLDPVTNAQVAYYMTGHGTNFGSWGYGPDAYDGTPSEPSITQWLSKFPD